MKKFLSLILSMVLLLSVAPTGVFSITASAATSGYYTYTTSDSKATITDVSDSISGAITIPSTLGGYPVVEIDYQAFKDCINVVSVIIPDSVVTIDISAFAGCTELTDITIGSGVTSISSSAFSGCTNLSGIWVNESNTAYSNDEKGVLFNKAKTTIISAPKTIQSYIVPHGVTSIGYLAFSECSNLTSLSLSNSLLSIGGSAFVDCTNITSITIPESVVSIDDSAFSKCSKLASISIPRKVAFIGEGVFKGCASLSGIWVDANNPIYSNDAQGVLFNKNKTTLIQAPGAIQSYTVPYGVTEICASAFEDCTALTNMTLSSSVLCIGQSAFYGCTNLKYNTYSNCRYLGTSSNSYFALIEDATILTSCQIHSNTKIIADYAIFSYYLTSVTIPSGVIRIGTSAFSSAMNLKNVSIPSSVISFGRDIFSSLADNLSYSTYGTGKYLGNSSNPYLVLIGTTSTSITSFSVHKNTKAIANEAFQYCNSLTSVTIPEGVTSIGDWAFYSCDKLSNITIPDTVTEIGTLAFSDCGSLTSITIPDSVVRIGDYAFSDCGNLTGIWVEESNPSFCSDEKGVLFNKNQTILIQAPGEISGSYPVPDGVVSIGDSAFESCYNLSSITISDSVTKIGQGAFSYCYYIKNVWYMGSQSNREQDLMVGTGNDYLNKATWYYDSCIEKETHTYIDCEDLACDVCGKSRESSHTYEWVIDQESNCIYTGVKHEECGVCHVKRNENTIIPVTGIHTFTDANDIECDICNEAFYQISFNSNGGTTIATIVIRPGETTSIPTDIPTRNGYVFDGWSLTKNGDVDYQSGAAMPPIDKSTTLYAQWNKICSTCKGNGIEDYSVKCTYCSGKGTVTSSTSCSTCSGDGKIESTTSVTCTLCNGTGKGDVHDAACGFCAGYGGYFTYKCSGGHSMMSKYRLYSCSTCGSYSITETIHKCSTCGGYGTVKSDKCKVCDGKGSTSEQNSTTCYMCSGSGYANADCSHCVGGYIAKTRSCAACNATGEVIRKSVSTPSAPVVRSFDETVVTLQEISNGEYSIDGVNWQESPVFENLISGNAYTFYQRYAKTDTTQRSASSSGLTVVAHAHTYDNACDAECNICDAIRTVPSHSYTVNCNHTCDACLYSKTPDAPIVESKTHNSITLVPMDGFEYSKDGVIWQASNVFTNLSANTTYTFYQRVKASDVASVSATSAALTAKTNEEPVYTVTFKNWDGSVISTNTYHYGDEVTAPADPTKTASNTYTYTFSGWDSEVVACNGDATYAATYTPVYIDYTIVFKNWDGSVISTKTYHWGDIVTVPINPTKAADNTYTYAFKSWDKAVVNCAGNVTYTATYTSTYIDYTVVFKNWDGTVLSTKTYHYGDTVTAPAIPARPSDNTYIYTFTGWDKMAVVCNGNAVYTAVYSSQTRTPSVVTSSTYTVSGTTISKISTGTTVSTLVGELNEGQYVKVYNGSQEVSGSTLIGTGMLVKIMDGSTAKATYTIVVTGDTSGDGNISIMDFVQLKSHLLNKDPLEGAYGQAADTNGDGNISIMDFVNIKAHLLGKSQVEPQSVSAKSTAESSYSANASSVSASAVQNDTSACKQTSINLAYTHLYTTVPEKKKLVIV